MQFNICTAGVGGAIYNPMSTIIEISRFFKIFKSQCIDYLFVLLITFSAQDDNDPTLICLWCHLEIPTMHKIIIVKTPPCIKKYILDKSSGF